MRPAPAKSPPIARACSTRSAPPRRRSASRICSPTAPRRRSNSRWSSRPTCRARSKRSSTRSTRSRPTRSSVRVLHSGVGAITESDVTLAASTGAPIIGFNVRPNAKAREAADAQQGRAALLRRHLPPHRLGEGRDGGRAWSGDHRERSSAAPRSRKSSRPASATRPPACWCSKASSARGSTPASPARTSSSRRRPSPRCAASRTTSNEVSAGMECGVLLADTNDIKPGDNLEVFEVEERARTL